MTQRATVSREEITSHNLPSAGEVASSTDYKGTGPQVRDGASGFNREVNAAGDLSDNDIIAIDGMELRVKHARELGLLDRVFDEQLNAASARQREPQNEAEDAKPVSNTGHEEYDTAVNRLNEHLESGTMEFDEASTYDTALAEVAMSGLSMEHAIETAQGLEDGSVDAADVPGDVRAMVEQVRTNVTKTATETAMRELGKEGFDALSQLAAVHPGVNASIERYALDRMRGLHKGITWPELADFLREDIGA